MVLCLFFKHYFDKFFVLSFSIRVIQRTGVNSGVPVYVVGVFSGDKMLAEGKTESTTQVVIVSIAESVFIK